jgi:hypothetical protein
LDFLTANLRLSLWRVAGERVRVRALAVGASSERVEGFALSAKRGAHYRFADYVNRFVVLKISGLTAWFESWSGTLPNHF